MLENTNIVFKKLINTGDKFIVLFKDSKKGNIYPIFTNESTFKFLEEINKDNVYKNTYLVDIVYEIDKPKSIFISSNAHKPYYLNHQDKKRILDFKDLLILSIRYKIPLTLEFLDDDIKSSYSDIDLYGLKSIDFEKFQH